MIRQIAFREILESFLSLRFALSLLLSTCLFAVCGYVFVMGYPEQLSNYHRKTNETVEGLRGQTSSLYRVAFYEQGIYRKPRPLAMCAEGQEKTLPNYFEVNAFSTDLPTIKGQVNIALGHFSNVDWVLIISLILSFEAMVLTYDSISGEKEAGTLRLILAHTIPRHKILLGKYIGAMFTLAIPLLVGILVSLLIAIPSKDIAINPAAWARIIAIVILSLLYLSIFVWVGLFVSGRTGHPANSMAILLLVWIISVVLLPSICRIVFDVSVKEPSQVELERQLDEVSRDIWDNADRYGERAGYMSNDPNDLGNNPPARARLRNAARDAQNQIMEEHHNKLLAQASGRRSFASLSPAVIYQRACEAFAGTGMDRCVHLYRQVKRYGADLKEFIRQKDLEDSKSLHLMNPEINTAISWRAISHNPVDFETVPKFQEREPTLSESLRLVVWDIGLLILLNLALFVASFVSFLRYDVR